MMKKPASLSGLAASMLLALHGHAGAATTPVYFNDFSDATVPLAEWSSAGTSDAPSGERFLGRFSGSGTTLTLALPMGTQNVTLAFDFYAIDSWDGQGPASGTDAWGVRIVNGPTLFQETFNTMNGFPPYGSQGQSFGGQGQPAGTYAPRTGAAANDTLQFDSGALWGSRDSTYRLSFTFAYAQPTLAIDFFDLGLQGLADESWGLDNVRVLATSGSQVPEPPGLLLSLTALGCLAARRNRWTKSR